MSRGRLTRVLSQEPTKQTIMVKDSSNNSSPKFTKTLIENNISVYYGGVFDVCVGIFDVCDGVFYITEVVLAVRNAWKRSYDRFTSVV